METLRNNTVLGYALTANGAILFTTDNEGLMVALPIREPVAIMIIVSMYSRMTAVLLRRFDLQVQEMAEGLAVKRTMKDVDDMINNLKDLGIQGN